MSRKLVAIHRVLAGAEKVLDAQVLLDPFEKEFDLPAAFVKVGNRSRRQHCFVGQKDERLVCSRVFESNASDVFRIVLGSVVALEHHTLIGNHATASVAGIRVDAPGPKRGLGSGDVKGTRLMQPIESLKIQISPIHDIKRPRLEDQHVEHLGVVNLAVVDIDKRWDCAAQIQQGVHLHGRLCRAKQRPRKQTHAQIDGARIQGVDRIGELYPKSSEA